MNKISLILIIIGVIGIYFSLTYHDCPKSDAWLKNREEQEILSDYVPKNYFASYATGQNGLEN